MHRLKPGVKINGTYFATIFRDRCFFLTFVQHLELKRVFLFFSSTVRLPPSHRANDTVALLYQETSDFVPPTLWPPNLLNLNPVEYTVWSVLQDRVYRTKVSDVDRTETTRHQRVGRSESHGY